MGLTIFLSFYPFTKIGNVAVAARALSNFQDTLVLLFLFLLTVGCVQATL